ncbi:MAG TPA: hypothetical protein VF789_16295 [Thermoanaerobaculia bacterium]
MFRNNRRALLLAVLVMLLGLSAAQAQVPAWTPVGPIAKPFCSGTVFGFGDTIAEAQANAVAEAKSKYFLFSYTVVQSRCDQIEIPDPTPLNPFATQTETICWVELKICGIYKAAWATKL